MKIISILLILINISSAQLENLYKEALALEKAKEDAKALILFQRILEQDSNHVEALVHSANLSTQLGVNSNDRDIMIGYFYQGIDYSEKAKRVAPEYDEAYLSYARSYGRLALISPTKQQLEISKIVKTNVDKALELNPENDIAWHILGKWYFRFADLSWFERTMAGLIYGDVPEATFEEAKVAFQKALDIRPKGIAHRVELAKTCIELDHIAEAKTNLDMVIDAPILLSTDNVYKREARQILSSLE